MKIPKAMTNEELLIEIRKERPTQVIHKVISFELNQYGFLDVLVDMELPGGDLELSYMPIYSPTIKHIKTKLPYPYKEYQKLTKTQQSEWRWSTIKS